MTNQTTSRAAAPTDVLENAWFVPASRIADYKPSEIVTETDDDGHKRHRVPKMGEFVYRLAGCDRKKKISYLLELDLKSRT
jgi:hypothetical protein